METVSASSSSIGDRNRDMEMLTEAFGLCLSLEAIASAYSQAGLNVEMAGALLYELQENSSNTTSAVSKEADESVKSEQANESSAVACSSSNVKDNDIGEFLFRMLGDGFQFDMDKIQEIHGICGYDLEKSMDTLLDISASTLEKSDDVVSNSGDTAQYQEIGPYSCYEKEPLTDYPGPRLVKQNGKQRPKKTKGTSILPSEILGALFIAPERIEDEPPKKIIPRSKKRKPIYGRRSVVKPPEEETVIEQSFVAVKPLTDCKEEEEDDENSFLVLRQAVREHWATMKEYYKAAVEAYTKGDTVRASKLMKEGQFFNKLARDADEKSMQKVIETGPDEEMLLNVSTFEPKDAIKLLKLHLSNLAGIPGIRYLKIIVGDDDAENQKRSLKRLVLKFLGRESIGCTETDNGKTLVIQLDEIKPETLSFAKKEED